MFSHVHRLHGVAVVFVRHETNHHPKLLYIHNLCSSKGREIFYIQPCTLDFLNICWHLKKFQYITRMHVYIMDPPLFGCRFSLQAWTRNLTWFANRLWPLKSCSLNIWGRILARLKKSFAFFKVEILGLRAMSVWPFKLCNFASLLHVSVNSWAKIQRVSCDTSSIPASWFRYRSVMILTSWSVKRLIRKRSGITFH